jgi:uncharacterized protein (DUF2141 family)
MRDTHKPFPTTRTRPQRLHIRRLLALALPLVTLSAWGATDLVVKVTGLAAPLGEVGCSLYAASTGFPMDNSTARVVWQPAATAGTECRFSGVTLGRYAFAIAHDLNGNQRVDTNFVGMPTEQWGVSNNVRPALRAPRFEEAVFAVPADAGEVTIAIEVAK